MVLIGNYSAKYHHYMAHVVFFQAFHYLGQVSLICAGEKAHANNVHILLDSHFHHFVRLTVTRVHHLKARILAAGRNQPQAPVVNINPMLD
jgi:galactose-1-phosphate uridylyltransferase